MDRNAPFQVGLFSLEKTELKNTDSWSCITYEDFLPLFMEGGSLKKSVLDEVQYILDGDFQNFRIQIEIDGAPFLFAFFYDTKIVRIYSQRLGQELFLTHSLDKLSDTEINDFFGMENFQNLKKHTEKAMLLEMKSAPTVIERVTKKYGLPNLLEKDGLFCEVEKHSEQTIKKLLVHINNYKPSSFEKISDFGLGLTANYALIRIHLLKFLAILPSLDYDVKGVEVKRILLESLRRLIEDSEKAKRLKRKGQLRGLPSSYIFLIKIVFSLSSIFPAKSLASVIRMKVRFMAKRFIAGETIETAEKSIESLAASGRDVTLDQLGELVVSEKEADHYRDEVLKLVRGLSLHIKKGETNEAGILRAHVSIKISALCSDFKPHAPEYTYTKVGPRLRAILLAAKEEDVFINIDAEHFDYRDIVFDIYKRVLLETPELQNYSGTGIVLQAYLRDAYEHLIDIISLAQKRNIMMPIRLVKGAYWDAETVEADAHSFDAPEFLNKEETDLHFRQLIVKIFEAGKDVQLCLASHNFADHAFAEALRHEKFKTLPIIEHQCLHMTYEALSVGMTSMKWVVRNYVPIGELIVGMAYLVRRIMENSSQVGVLTIMRSHKKQRSIVSAREVHLAKKEAGSIAREETAEYLSDEFFNVSPVRLYLKKQREAALFSLDHFKNSNLGENYENDFLLKGEKENIYSSSNRDIFVGQIKFGTKEDGIKAANESYSFYSVGSWANAPWQVRSTALIKTGLLLTKMRKELAALVVYEAGKILSEAFADVDEAIDFLYFYAREEGRLQKINSSITSRGPIAVIAPWNFPLAIPCGMVASALVSGNTVILKSAEQTPLIAQKLVSLFHLAGVPKEALIHLPGLGEIVGDALANSDKIAGIVFTGSKKVGMHLAHSAGKNIFHNPLTKLSYPVKVITEMGGKNAIIVTANAELDETVSGILYSAFGHAGQKCSAASRILVDRRVKEKLISRLKQAVLDLEVGEAFKLETTVNPVVSPEDQERLKESVKEATLEVQKFSGKVIVDRTIEDLPGLCVGPAVFELPIERSFNSDSFATKELFGPVLHVAGFDSLDQALSAFNGTDYALTGGVFSQSQDDIDYLTTRMDSGNIYVNRSITGARVGVEPFGGFKLSGTGPKAGSKSYLTSFHINYSVNDFDDSLDSDCEEGSDYYYDLCRPSRLKADARVANFRNGLEALIRNFEYLFKGIDGKNRETLLAFKKWCKNNLLTFQTKEHPNRKIPGQISFNDFSKMQEYAVVASYNERPSFITLMQVFGAISMGTGVTVLARNRKAFHWWSQVRDFFGQSGIAKGNFDVFFSSESNLEKTLENPMIHTIIIDGRQERIRQIISYSLSGDCNEKRMKSFLTNLDAADPNDFKRICEQYAKVRSFAINTMRHGAPLDLDL